MAQELQKHSEQRAAERASEPVVRDTRGSEGPQEIERRVVVPLVDELPEGRIVYHPSIGQFGLAGAAAGALLLGLLAWLVASGVWSLRDVGQFAASGPAVGTFTGAGIGAALGALLGALGAMYRLPAHHAD